MDPSLRWSADWWPIALRLVDHVTWQDEDDVPHLKCHQAAGLAQI